MDWIDAVIFPTLLMLWACFCFHVERVWRERERKQRAIDRINAVAKKMQAQGWDVEIGVERHR